MKVCVSIVYLGLGEFDETYEDHQYLGSKSHINFATDSFKLSPLPATTTRANFILLKVRGSLGALAYWKSSELSIKLFVREGTSWDVLYDDVPSLVDVERPLGLKDDRWLFVEAKARDGGGQLMVYDLYTKESKKLDIYDVLGLMYGISYDAESTDPPLPGSTPITNCYFEHGGEGEEDESSLLQLEKTF